MLERGPGPMELWFVDSGLAIRISEMLAEGVEIGPGEP